MCDRSYRGKKVYRLPKAIILMTSKGVVLAQVGGEAGIFSLKHESSILKDHSSNHVTMWFFKSQASYPWDKQYRAQPVPS